MHVADQRQFYNEAFVRFSERNELFHGFKNITENLCQHIKQIILLLLLVFRFRSKRCHSLGQKWNPYHSRLLILDWIFVLRCWRQQFVCISIFYAETIYICNSFLTIQVGISCDCVNINPKQISANIVSKLYKISYSSQHFPSKISCPCQYLPLLVLSIKKLP